MIGILVEVGTIVLHREATLTEVIVIVVPDRVQIALVVDVIAQVGGALDRTEGVPGLEVADHLLAPKNFVCRKT